MLDVGWSELLVIAVVLIVVVGPKDLPPMLRAFGKMTARLRAMAGEFRTQFDEALKESELDEVRKTIGDAQRLNPMNTIREAINPIRQTANEIRTDLQGAVSSPASQQADKPAEAKGVTEPGGQAAQTVPASGGEAALPPLESQPVEPVAQPVPEPVSREENTAVLQGDATRKDGA